MGELPQEVLQNLPKGEIKTEARDGECQLSTSAGQLLGKAMEHSLRQWVVMRPV